MADYNTRLRAAEQRPRLTELARARREALIGEAIEGITADPELGDLLVAAVRAHQATRDGWPDPGPPDLFDDLWEQVGQPLDSGLFDELRGNRPDKTTDLVFPV